MKKIFTVLTILLLSAYLSACASAGAGQERSERVEEMGDREVTDNFEELFNEFALSGALSGDPLLDARIILYGLLQAAIKYLDNMYSDIDINAKDRRVYINIYIGCILYTIDTDALDYLRKRPPFYIQQTFKLYNEQTTLQYYNYLTACFNAITQSEYVEIDDSRGWGTGDPTIPIISIIKLDDSIVVIIPFE